MSLDLYLTLMLLELFASLMYAKITTYPKVSLFILITFDKHSYS